MSWSSQRAKYPEVSQLSTVTFWKLISHALSHKGDSILPALSFISLNQRQYVAPKKEEDDEKCAAHTVICIFCASPVSVPRSGCCFWRPQVMFFCPMYFFCKSSLNGLMNKLSPFYYSSLGGIESYSRHNLSLEFILSDSPIKRVFKVCMSR